MEAELGTQTYLQRLTPPPPNCGQGVVRGFRIQEG